MAGPAKKPDAKAPKKSGKLKIIFAMVLVGIAMPFTLPTIVLVLVALAPTYVTYMTEDDPEKYGAASVGVMNLAGVVPFVIDLWSKGQTLSEAFRILVDSNAWFIILSASAIGQLLIYAVPHAIATLSVSHAESRIKALKKNLDLLKESWGPEVATIKPLDQIRG